MVALRSAVNMVRREVGAADYLAILGSSSFWHQNSQVTCRHIGRKLAELNSLSIITGGMERLCCFSRVLT